MIHDTTGYLHLPLPHKDNLLEDDAPRLRSALEMLDTHAQQADTALEGVQQGLAETASDVALQALTRQVQTVAASVPALSNSVISESETDAASSKAVKAAHDKGVEAKAAADAALVAAGQGFIAGGIVPFSGSFGGSDSKRPIPRGKTVADESWVLCDGTNGTPDMRDRFVVGAGGKYAKDSKGGSETHSHSVSGSANSATLSTSQMPSHGHSYSTYTFIDGAGAPNYKSVRQGDQYVNTGYTGGSSSHSHSLSASASTANGLPPYYALSYIMKL